MFTLSGRKSSQDEWELTQFIDLMKARKVRRYLEIGARDGDTFYNVVTSLRSLTENVIGIAVDLPGAPWGVKTSADRLKACSDILNAKGGIKTAVMLGNSADPEMVEWCGKFTRTHGLFDAILIDGDHRYAGVATDWRNYGPLGKMIAFHDIAGHGVTQKSTGEPVEVPRLWEEIKAQDWASHGRVLYEFVNPDAKMGIGVVVQS